ncbi:amidohydrolase [Alsobacter sp. SYSU M60028]|uniref:Amidohydrolase n=1 Tax=Alsobacter ponti TaxID=2962936 RepID=A0ABT1LBE8_9HYPH|nr:amidohydrolase family protein [Alsobacter ponti]MCP8937578.1 amidohydrolase [Alsobacter ponti]
MDFGIVDGHCHIFPPLAGASGFPDVATHRLHQQRAMHMHGNQPYRRLRDHALVTERMLWNPDDPSEAGRATDVTFSPDRHGRVGWEKDGERYYVQFLPPYMTDLSAPAETIVAQMDYAGIATSILQNDHIYGNLAEDFAAAGRAYPGRFIGLAQVEEAFAWRDDQIAALHRQVSQLGMAGLYFTTTGMFRSGFTPLHDDRAYDPFWREVEKLDLPVWWVQSARSPVGDYADEMRCMANISERFPGLRHVLVHGVPTSVFADEADRIALPDILTSLLKGGRVWSELLYPIAWGGRHEYPYPKARVHFRQLFDAFGPDRFVWGSDMPNVERYCTYRQSLTYAWNHFEFLDDAARRKIFRENALSLFHRPPILGA